MPNEIVWVDKVIHPRSVVLTYNEALTVLKNAKNLSGRSQRKAECSPPIRILSTTLKMKDQKQKCLDFIVAQAQEIEVKSIVEMQAELKSIEASKVILKGAMDKRVISVTGLPQLKHSELLKKGILKKQRGGKKKDSAALHLTGVGSSVINKEAVKKLLEEEKDDDDNFLDNKKDDEDVIVVSPSSASDPDPIILSDEEEEVVEKKKRRIVISDDEDIIDDIPEQISSSIQIKSLEDDVRDKISEPLQTQNFSIKKIEIHDPSETILKIANDPNKFREAFSTCIEASNESPPTITFEVDCENKVQVIASTTIALEVINDAQLPTNVMFTNKAISSLLNETINDNNNIEDKWRTHLLGNSKAVHGSIALINQPDVKISERTSKIPYQDFIKDKKFRSKLLNLSNPETDYAPYFGIEIKDDDNEDVSRLPKMNILNSLFGFEDLEMLQFKTNREKMGSSLIRQKQRVQHPIVNVPIEYEPKSIVKKSSNIIPKQPSSYINGLKSILKKTKNEEDPSAISNDLKKRLIAHNTVIHEALNYLTKNKASQKTSKEIKESFDKLSKYPLTLLEKHNFINTMPKDLPGMLCMLDDLGLRFSKEALEEMEKDCIELSKTVDSKQVNETTEEEHNEEGESDQELRMLEKRVKFNKNVQKRLM